MNNQIEWTSLGIFLERESQQIQSRLRLKQLQKNEFLLREGMLCQSMYFIQSGCVYEYTMGEVEERVTALYGPGEWCMNYSSFISQSPSQTSIKAYAATQVLELTLVEIHALIALSPVYLQLGKLLEGALHRSQYGDAAMNPTERYHQLLKDKPQLLQLFPLKMIASYLQIAPETLSRVRARF
ncbi:Crp/Fnr family transcriptional regulator [Siphonobacter sp. SORGH_AS_0500]|uniref:Crp/Fnr family transcriptional regulator n=1 Tax=Siphonobacter sp. SORGH_AS_0500 TaxID=1864824 RepID=UPI002866171A|nr:Crp/Fnr family transcriptional regulator [Siphonobacter sp. SORGH_AS_0500]MDR6197110.1 CRP-like cAMP-binding protein [Siphonobacter sp. SORGH_AS_0500]